MIDKIIFNNNRIINFKIIEESILIGIDRSQFVNCILTFELINNDYLNFTYFSLEITEKYIAILRGGYFLDDESNISNNLSQDVIEIFDFKNMAKIEDYNSNLSLILNENKVQIKINGKILSLTDILQNYKKNIYIFNKINNAIKFVDSYMELNGIYSPQDLLFENKES